MEPLLRATPWIVALVLLSRAILGAEAGLVYAVVSKDIAHDFKKVINSTKCTDLKVNWPMNTLQDTLQTLKAFNTRGPNTITGAQGRDEFRGELPLAVADLPMMLQQETTGVSRSIRKLTIPLWIARYSFFIAGKRDGAVRLTANETLEIFRNGSEKYTPVSRGDNSGSNYLMKAYWAKSGVRALTQADTQDPTSPFRSVWRCSETTVRNTSSLLDLFARWQAATDLAASVNISGIDVVVPPPLVAFSQVGVGLPGEVMLKDGSGKWVLPSLAGRAQIPPLPSSASPWYTVPSSLILRRSGPPIVAFVYATILKKYGSKYMSLQRVPRDILGCIMRATSAPCPKCELLPRSVIEQNVLAKSTVGQA